MAERQKILPKVFYTWSQVQDGEKFDPGFGKNVDWDIPLLEGYEFIFVDNVSKNPGSKSFKGIDNPTLLRQVADWKPDAVLVFGWKFKSHLKAIKFFHGKMPVFFRGDSTTLNESGGWKALIRQFVLKHVYRHIDYALFVGMENRRYYENAGLPVSKLHFAPHAVDNAKFANRESVRDGRSLRQSLNISDDAIVFVYAGKFEPVKNPMLLLSVANKMALNHICFVFVGNGPLEEVMKRIAGDGIYFLNFQNQSRMPAVYNMADVVVLPSTSETWGLVVNEAMAAGRPVLVSDRCGCAADLVEEGITGYVFRSNDETDLQKKISLMASDKLRLQEMGRHAQRKIQDWSFERIADAIEGLMTKKA